jgi:hypothetical protein
MDSPNVQAKRQCRKCGRAKAPTLFPHSTRTNPQIAKVCRSCKNAAERLRYHRDPLVHPTFEERFWSKVDRSKPEGCWLWTASRSSFGYGTFGVARGKYKLSHRVSWELANGTIPTGLFVCHRCDTAPCVNPAHLFLGTHQDNMTDKMRKGRHRVRIGSESVSSKLTEADVVAIRASAHCVQITEISRLYGVNRSTIQRIIDRVTWKHVACPHSAALRTLGTQLSTVRLRPSAKLTAGFHPITASSSPEIEYLRSGRSLPGGFSTRCQ